MWIEGSQGERESEVPIKRVTPPILPIPLHPTPLHRSPAERDNFTKYSSSSSMVKKVGS